MVREGESVFWAVREPLCSCAQVLADLAGHPDLLHWHLMKHPSRSLTLCISALADDAGECLLACPARCSPLNAVFLSKVRVCVDDPAASSCCTGSGALVFSLLTPRLRSSSKSKTPINHAHLLWECRSPHV